MKYLSIVSIMIVCFFAIQADSVFSQSHPQAAALPSPWPPEVGKDYPDLTLVNHKGVLTKLSDFKGKVIILEPIGMTCPACNAFAGGGKHGTMPGVQGGNMPSFEEFFRRDMQKIDYDDPRIMHVSLLLYNLAMQGPTQEDAKVWAEHFKIADRSNHVVLAGGARLVNNASYNMVPGFQLIDKKGILRADSSGHNPRDDLRKLLAMVPTLAEEME